MPLHKRMEEVLARWREAERRLEAATPGSPDEDRLAAQVFALREEYGQLEEQVRAELGSGEPQLSG